LIIQFVMPVMIGLFIGLFIAIFGTNSVDVTRPFGLFFIVEIICLILSFMGMLFTLKHASSMRDDPEAGHGPVPPPPPQFEV